VRPGETLRDIAIRVYGSADDLDSLWRANRDVLPHKDSPLMAGSVLRTPTNTPGE
jgi:nucleoid-associated protein YgaU